MPRRIPVATIAGSDPSGGAGVQADLRVFTLLGAFGQTVITSLTVQNSLGVKSWQAVDPGLVAAQLEALVEDFPPVAVKTGMLAKAETIEKVSKVLACFRPLLVVDPVILAKGGEFLLEQDAISALKEYLFPLATVITPNLPEAEILLGKKIPPGGEEEACKELLSLGPKAIILKGGHAGGLLAKDYIYDGQEMVELSLPRIMVERIGHGTGCTFSAALTVYLAQGLSLSLASSKAKQFVTLALISAWHNPLGQGISPTDHLVHLERLEARFLVLERLEEAVMYFCQHPVRPLVPEVQINLAYALPYAQDYSEVAAFPGRIVAIGERAQPVGCPKFGASRHVTNVVLTAMRHDPRIRAAMNIKFEEKFLVKAASLGFKIGEFSREEEPPEIKAREGATIPWGVDLVCRRLGYVPDIIADRGEIGKEPMIRVLGMDAMEVVKKAIRLLD